MNCKRSCNQSHLFLGHTANININNNNHEPRQYFKRIYSVERFILSTHFFFVIWMPSTYFYAQNLFCHHSPVENMNKERGETIYKKNASWISSNISMRAEFSLFLNGLYKLWSSNLIWKQRKKEKRIKRALGNSLIFPNVEKTFNFLLFLSMMY